MSLQQTLEKEVKEYNEFAQQVSELKDRAAQAEQERLIRLGGVQKLAQLVQEEAETLNLNGSKDEVPSEVIAVADAEN